MKIKIDSYEEKTKLPELLRQVKTGKSFTITKRECDSKGNVAAVEKLKAFILANPVRGGNIKNLIEEGRA